MRPTVLLVRCDSATGRQYVFRKASADGSVKYFRCRRCEYLNKNEAVEGRSYAVNVHVKNDKVSYQYGEAHHPRCNPEPIGKLKALQINRKYKRVVRTGQETPFEAFRKAAVEARCDGDALAYFGSWNSVDASYDDHYRKFLAASLEGTASSPKSFTLSTSFRPCPTSEEEA